MDTLFSDILGSLGGLGPFVIYFVPAVITVKLFMWVYALFTPHEEVALMKDNNPAAAIAYVGTMLGFTFPVMSVIFHAVDLIDFTVWIVLAAVIQLATFFIFRSFYPKISERIEKGEIALALKLAGTSVMVGLLNAASISY